jgi:hypothetical protein
VLFSLYQQMLKMSATFSKACFMRLCEMSVGRYWQQSVRYCVSVPPSLLGYSNKPLCFEIFSQKEVWRGEVWRSRWPRFTPNSALTKESCSKAVVFAVWDVVSSRWNQQSLFRLFSTDKWLASEDSDTVSRCLLKKAVGPRFAFETLRFAHQSPLNTG